MPPAVTLPIPLPAGLFLPTPSPQGAGLTLLGVGPGDPELLTVAAVRAIASADVVAYPVAREGGEGMAAAIAAPCQLNTPAHTHHPSPESRA